MPPPAFWKDAFFFCETLCIVYIKRIEGRGAQAAVSGALCLIGVCKLKLPSSDRHFVQSWDRSFLQRFACGCQIATCTAA